jgi:hypothetical protein
MLRISCLSASARRERRWALIKRRTYHSLWVPTAALARILLNSVCALLCQQSYRTLTSHSHQERLVTSSTKRCWTRLQSLYHHCNCNSGQESTARLFLSICVDLSAPPHSLLDLLARTGRARDMTMVQHRILSTRIVSGKGAENVKGKLTMNFSMTTPSLNHNSVRSRGPTELLK